jgi:hypothetical protein
MLFHPIGCSARLFAGHENGIRAERFPPWEKMRLPRGTFPET